MQPLRTPALMDTDALSTVPVCNCHRRRNSLPGPGKFNTVHFSAPGHVTTSDSSPPSHEQPHRERENGSLPIPPTAQLQESQAQALQDIPVQYIVDQLHRLGPFYWHKPETTDCTIRKP